MMPHNLFWTYHWTNPANIFLFPRLLISTCTNNPITVCGRPVYHASQRIIQFTHRKEINLGTFNTISDAMLQIWYVRTSGAGMSCKYSAKFCGFGCFCTVWGGLWCKSSTQLSPHACQTDIVPFPQPLPDMFPNLFWELRPLVSALAATAFLVTLILPILAVAASQAPNLAFHFPRHSQLGLQCLVT